MKYLIGAGEDINPIGGGIHVRGCPPDADCRTFCFVYCPEHAINCACPIQSGDVIRGTGGESG